MAYFVYILADKPNGNVHVGSASDLREGIARDSAAAVSNGSADGTRFETLVYFEVLSDENEAIQQEQQLKSAPKQTINDMIARFNPQWKDLSGQIPF
ncbi:putative endonuclease [Labrenzia sp. EL_159]|nr:putative endonuclease [Labrenzia sp. EL_162]MBG6194803.1 putative endonuclease [Labrenzia sp. EL_159]